MNQTYLPILGYCEMCNHMAVMCGRCGNNGCNGGAGQIDGENCPTCVSDGLMAFEATVNYPTSMSRCVVQLTAIELMDLWAAGFYPAAIFEKRGAVEIESLRDPLQYASVMLGIDHANYEHARHYLFQFEDEVRMAMLKMFVDVERMEMVKL